MATTRSSRRPWTRGDWLALLAAGALACGGSATAPADREEQFDTLWETFDQTYPYFGYKQIDWNAARDEFRTRAANAATMGEFVGIIRQMLAPLRDLHVYLEAPGGIYTPTWTPLPDTVNWDRDTWQNYVLRNGWHQVGNWGWGLWDDVGYIAIGGWTDGQFRTADFDAVLEQLRGASAIILDVRMNGGGNDALAFSVAARFADRDHVTGYTRVRNGPGHDDLTAPAARTLTPRGPWQYTGPVTVLSGRGVFSSNESFISAMRELPQVTIMGDTTGGASGNPRRFAMGDGWFYTVSTWIELTPDQRVIEWQGIEPDLYVPWSRITLAAGIDETLDLALARAHSSARR